MKQIQFSELTNRLHRNMMLAASLIIAISFFQIKVGKVTASGIELTNFTTSVLVAILLAVLIYHAVAFIIRAFEEYRIWELQLTNKEASLYGGGTATIELIDQFKDAAETLKKITANAGMLRHQNQQILTADEARQLRDAADTAVTYGKRLKNFPRITRVRFWFWDIGVAGLITATGAMFGLSTLPSGYQLLCLS